MKKTSVILAVLLMLLLSVAKADDQIPPQSQITWELKLDCGVKYNSNNQGSTFVPGESVGSFRIEPYLFPFVLIGGEGGLFLIFETGNIKKTETNKTKNIFSLKTNYAVIFGFAPPGFEQLAKEVTDKIFAMGEEIKKKILEGTSIADATSTIEIMDKKAFRIPKSDSFFFTGGAPLADKPSSNDVYCLKDNIIIVKIIPFP
ncbi:MAG: hypothetical protein WCV41_01350 [Patescibacteria group bacterium]